MLVLTVPPHTLTNVSKSLPLSACSGSMDLILYVVPLIVSLVSVRMSCIALSYAVATGIESPEPTFELLRANPSTWTSYESSVPLLKN